MKHFKSLFFAISALTAATLLFSSCGKNESEESAKMEKEFVKFADDFEGKAKKIYSNAALAYWNASISGSDEDFKKSEEFEIELTKLYSDTAAFNKIKEFKESGMIKDSLQARRLEIMYNDMLGNQIDPDKIEEMTKIQTKIIKNFQKFRPVVDGEEITDNQVEEILKTSKDSDKLKRTWEAHKLVGPAVEEDLLKLIRMRNDAAKELGFSNFHEMKLKLGGQDPEELEKLFDELDELTRDAFIELKKEMDEVLSKQLNVKPEELMPWHYQNRYFQEAPKIYSIDLDPYYKDKDIVELTKTYYDGIGMPIEDIVANSDLFEKPNKNPHAFCTDINRDTKDIRCLCNIQPNVNWMNTNLHEFGHAVYFKYHSDSLPWTLKTPAHIFTTEAIAMLFGRMATNPKWMLDMGVVNEEQKTKIAETAKNILRLEQIVFSRWAQVMYRFEKAMYADPDQDLNKLWWDIVEKYQMIKRPEGRNMPDWATKTHFSSSPCYYHNYLLGELLASQLYNYMTVNIMNLPVGSDCSFHNSKEAGNYLIEKVFAPGMKYPWNDMIEKATGEKLTAKYYAKQFVN